ncbi:MAG: stage II sporulation protein M [Armatimonadetes bacterium]|nr:stage II sporulation protein M [Armatimonadota bacterium]
MESPARRLDELLARIEGRPLSSLPDDDLLELGRVYRRASALLARARTAGVGGSDVEHLNRLVARAYPLVYAAPPRGSAGVADFLLNEFPRAFRRERRFIAVSVGIFLLGVLVGACALFVRPDSADALLGKGWNEALEHIAERHEGAKDWLPRLERPSASAGIMTNNIRVAINAFALGTLACLGSLYIMGYNGVMMGAVAVAVNQRGTDLNFWSFVVPHGSLEIPAILISGAAGMIIGYAFIAPGRLYRRDAVKLAARRAVSLLFGVVVLLVVAGLVEGFFSPSPDVGPVVKLLVGGMLFTLLCLWLSGGRATGPDPSP